MPKVELLPEAMERKLVLQLSKKYTEEDRYLHCLELEHFCERVKWDGVMSQDRHWNELI